MLVEEHQAGEGKSEHPKKITNNGICAFGRFRKVETSRGKKPGSSKQPCRILEVNKRGGVGGGGLTTKNKRGDDPGHSRERRQAYKPDG